MAYEDDLIKRESGGNANARNPLSSASGLAQFTDSTYRKYAQKLGLTGDKNDPANQIAALRAFTEDNRRYLSKYGIPDTDANLYGAHFAGPEGWRKLYYAPDDASVVDYVSPSALSANKSLFLNRDGTPKTAAQARASITKGFIDQGPVVTSQQAAPVALADASSPGDSGAVQSAPAYQPQSAPAISLDQFYQLFAPQQQDQQQQQFDLAAALASLING